MELALAEIDCAIDNPKHADPMLAIEETLKLANNSTWTLAYDLERVKFER